MRPWATSWNAISMPSGSRPQRPSSRNHSEEEIFMQRTLRNLAVALVAGTFAIAAGAQDKAEKSSKKSESAAKKSSAAGGKIVVNGVTIPQQRIDAMSKELTAQGQPDTAERTAAIREELVNRE